MLGSVMAKIPFNARDQNSHEAPAYISLPQRQMKDWKRSTTPGKRFFASLQGDITPGIHVISKSDCPAISVKSLHRPIALKSPHTGAHFCSGH
jgi:hypothetical protein